MALHPDKTLPLSFVKHYINDCCCYIYQDQSDKNSKHTYRTIPYKKGRLPATREKRNANKLKRESDTNDLLFDSLLLLFQILTGGLLYAALDWYYFCRPVG